jgi:hypothetical protein
MKLKFLLPSWLIFYHVFCYNATTQVPPMQKKPLPNLLPKPSTSTHQLRLTLGRLILNAWWIRRPQTTKILNFRL